MYLPSISSSLLAISALTLAGLGPVSTMVIVGSCAAVGLNELKAAVTGLDLGKLESMKDVGVTK